MNHQRQHFGRDPRHLAMAALAVLITTPSPGSAGNEKTLPGVACQWHWEEYFGQPVDRPTYWYHGAVENLDSTYPQAFSCPIPRDDVAAEGDGNIESVKVYVWDNHATQTLSCRVYHNDTSSSTYVTGSVDQSGSGLDTLLPPVPGTDYDGGAYSIYCTLPAASGILSYWWDE